MAAIFRSLPEMQSKYEDDQTFSFGEHLIYLNRHIVRAFQEAKEILLRNYPMIYPARAISNSMPQILKHKPEMIEKVYEIRVKVEDSPYQRAIEKIEGHQRETEK